jgi:hypothetical protein
VVRTFGDGVMMSLTDTSSNAAFITVCWASDAAPM